MRICYCLLYYDQAYREPQRYLEHAPIMRHLPQEVARLGYRVDVVILFPTAHTFEDNGVRYNFVRSAPFVSSVSRRAGRWLGRQPASMEPALRALRTIRRLQPDLIHFHGTNLYLNNFFLLAALGRGRPPIVVHHHGGYPSPNRWVRRLQRFNLRRATRLLFTTHEHAQPFLDAGLVGDPERVVAFMETSTSFRRCDRAEARRITGMRGDPVFLWAGRLEANKDPMTALRGFAQVLATWPDAHLYLHYLTDELLPTLQAFVAAHPALERHVHFQGCVAHERMEAVYNSADFLLQASHREFSGYAVLEALACGVIPVVTAIPSFEAMTDGGRYGVLFPPGDVDALVRGVLSLPRGQIPERAREHRAWFDRALSFPALARQLDTLYREILQGRDEPDMFSPIEDQRSTLVAAKQMIDDRRSPDEGVHAVSRTDRTTSPVSSTRVPPPRSIVFLIPGFPKDEADTGCLPAVQNYVAAFARAHPDLQTHVIAFQYPFVRDTYRWKDVTVHALAGKNRPWIGRAWTWLQAVRAFLRIYRQTTVRVLHSFWLTECTWVGCRLSQIFRIRHVASIGGQDARPDNPHTRHLGLGGALLTAGSGFAAETFTRHTGRAVDHVIPLGLDTDVLQRIERSKARDIDLLGVGSLIPVKDYAAFLDVVAALVSDFPHLKSCIVGDGPERRALRRRIAEHGLQQHVTLAGSLRREDTFRAMLRSKVFLHTARYEGQGYVFLEALFAGLPVVCFDVGYTGESDRVFRCRSRQEMTDTAASLLHHPPAFNPAPVRSVDDTVRAFEPLYELFSETARRGPSSTRLT